MNKAILIGNLTKDPETKTMPSSGKTMAKFTLAVNRQFKNAKGETEVDFIPTVVWGKTAENCAKFLRKGSQVAVVGEIQTRSYEAQDKTKRYVTEVVASEVQFLNRVGEQQRPQGEQSGRRTDDHDGMQDMQEVDEDMPF